jgi:hypothetical protein
VVILIRILAFGDFAFAKRDWEYWTNETFTIPINKKITYLIIPEWRFKNDMHNEYNFKLETGPSFKINEYLEITPYYVYQEKKSLGKMDRSDLAYLDETVRIPLKKLFNLKLSNRFRYQYDFDKGKAILRNVFKLSKSFKVAKLEITPYICEEPFYDARLDRITEHRTISGLTFALTKNTSFGLGYMYNAKWGTKKWVYANVLLSNLNIKF